MRRVLAVLGFFLLCSLCPIGCTSGDNCSSGQHCECSEGDQCYLGCGLECSHTNVCGGICGDNCHYDCHDTMQCSVEVGPGSVVTCTSVNDCAVVCNGSCTVNCSGDCVVDCANGGCDVNCGGNASATECKPGRFACGACP